MFTHKIEFGFGCELDKNREVIPPAVVETMLEQVESRARALFDGCTLVSTRGTWVNPEGVVFSERGYTLVVYTDMAGTYLTQGLGLWIKEILRQEAIAVCITEVNACIL